MENQRISDSFLRLFWIALGFLTILPTPAVSYRRGDLARSSFFFPLVGLLVGGINLSCFLLIYWLTKSYDLAAFFTLLAWEVQTRGLHLDGVADVCDAIWAGGNKDRTQILKDSRLGTFGALGIIVVLGLKFLLIREGACPLCLMIAPVVGRAGAIALGTFFSPLPREQAGLGEEWLGRVPPGVFFLWAAGLMAVSWLFLGGEILFLKIGISFVIIYLFGKIMKRIFGGLNGDMVGAGIELVETILLI